METGRLTSANDLHRRSRSQLSRFVAPLTRLAERLGLTLRGERPLWLNLCLIGLVVAFGLPLCHRGILLSDEGYLLLQSLDLLHGKVLYRDMDAFITPGIWFLLAGAFATFGPSVLISRALSLLAWVALIVVGHRIVAPLTNRSWGLAAGLALMLCSVWSFPAWTFAFYSPFAVVLSLWALERLLSWQRTRSARTLFMTGLLFGLAICFKQNYGVFALAGATIGFFGAEIDSHWKGNRSRSALARDLGVALSGVVLAGLPFFIYLAAHGALASAWQSLVIHPFEFAGEHDIPYASISDFWKPDLYAHGFGNLTYLCYAMLHSSPVPLLHAFRGVQRMHVLLYWLAPLTFAIGGVLAIWPRDRTEFRVDVPLLTLTSTCGFLFLGVFPRADFNHLMNVYQSVIVAGLPIAANLLGRMATHSRTKRAASIALACLGVAYAICAIHWYASLLEKLDAPLAQQRGGVLVDPLQAENINAQVRYIVEHSKPGEAVLTVPDLSMLNFLAERPVPSPYYNMYQHHIGKDQGAGVVSGSEAQHVRLAVTRYDNFFSDRVGLLDYAPILSRYLLTHFRRVLVGGNDDYMVFERRTQPLPYVSALDALADCDPISDENWNVDLRKHLLFSSLYHRSDSLHEFPSEGVRTRCHLRVPLEGGSLRLEIGYRQPYRVTRGTTARAQILVLDGQGSSRIADKTMRILPRSSSMRQPPYRSVRLDLAQWAGREIELLFESTLTGNVLVHPLDFRGFSVVWRDPRIWPVEAGSSE